MFLCRFLRGREESSPPEKDGRTASSIAEGRARARARTPIDRNARLRGHGTRRDRECRLHVHARTHAGRQAGRHSRCGACDAGCCSPRMASRTVITPESRPREDWSPLRHRVPPCQGRDGQQIILHVPMVHMASGVMILKDLQTGYPLNPEESVAPVGRPSPASRYLQIRDAPRNPRSQRAWRLAIIDESINTRERADKDHGKRPERSAAAERSAKAGIPGTDGRGIPKIPGSHGSSSM